METIDLLMIMPDPVVTPPELSGKPKFIPAFFFALPHTINKI
jgi:hypothetical protein